ncbi:hypothetical protein OH687_12170 [Burkholderia anthina]|nr:hypothetical protein OH687_12170 [Burkholderia anthina]
MHAPPQHAAGTTEDRRPARPVRESLRLLPTVSFADESLTVLYIRRRRPRARVPTRGAV